MKMRWLVICLGIGLTACTLSGKGSNSYPFNNELPLDVGSSWQYISIRYDGYNANDFMIATSTITNTILQFELVHELWVATIQSEQSAESLVEIQGNYPTEDILQGASLRTYWLIVEGQRIWKQMNQLDLSNLQDTAEVMLIFPLAVGQKWSKGNTKDLPPYIEVKRIGTVTVPAGSYSNCFLLESSIGGTTFQNWFCPGVGLVSNNAEHHGTPSLYTSELVRYSSNP